MLPDMCDFYAHHALNVPFVLFVKRKRMIFEISIRQLTALMEIGDFTDVRYSKIIFDCAGYSTINTVMI